MVHTQDVARANRKGRTRASHLRDEHAPHRLERLGAIDGTRGAGCQRKPLSKGLALDVGAGNDNVTV